MSIGENPGSVEHTTTVDSPASYSGPAEEPRDIGDSHGGHENPTEQRSRDGAGYAKKHGGDLNSALNEYVADHGSGEQWASLREIDKLGPEAATERRHALAQELIDERERLMSEPEHARRQIEQHDQELHERGLEHGERSAQAHEDQTRIEAAHQERINQYARANPGFVDRAQKALGGVNVGPHVMEAIQRSPNGVEILDRISQTLNGALAGENYDRTIGLYDSLEALNQLTPAQLREQFKYAEGICEGDRRWRQSRAHTKAPRPFSTPAGGAAPSRGLGDLANESNLDAYVAMRNRQDSERKRR